MKKKLVTLFVGLAAIISLAGCSSESDVVSENLSKSADSFEVQRRVVFFNGITDKYLLTIEGLCALDTSSSKKLTVTCKIGKDQYKKHYLGLSDNVSYFVEQTDAKYEDAFHYKVLFRPEQIVPDIDLQTSKGK
ncbi:putative lipoprotein [Bacillus phage BSP38]|uniref:Putative lipoprotein n=1 Tax=Bacillus phage BSP38 TaxID=2283013 RepID=A0A345MK81_BPBSP|nr:site-specific recombination directionality factor RDF [Bacillus phage BSP38]AXH71263.1 putative lipoprotein [Bacillus phage BSP38]